MTMTLDQIKSISANQFATEQQEAGQVTETTPSNITPAIDTFVKSLDAEAAQFLPVIADPNGLYGFCSDGVQEKIKVDGGRCVFGWSIWEWPDVMLTAEFHAIWEDVEGGRFDITPKPKNESQILFVADLSYVENFDFDRRPRNRRKRIYVGADPVEAAAAAKAKLSEGQRKYEEKRAQKAELNIDDWLMAKVPHDPLADTIDQLIKTCDEFDEHFDALGTAGTVAVDAKIRELALRRIGLQQQLKRQLNTLK